MKNWYIFFHALGRPAFGGNCLQFFFAIFAIFCSSISAFYAFLRRLYLQLLAFQGLSSGQFNVKTLKRIEILLQNPKSPGRNSATGMTRTSVVPFTAYPLPAASICSITSTVLTAATSGLKHSFSRAMPACPIFAASSGCPAIYSSTVRKES